MTPGPEYLVVGHVNKAHGTKGEVFVWPLTDYPGRTFVPGVVLRMSNDDTPDPDLPPLEISTVREFRRGYLVGFGGIDDRTAADGLRGRYLIRPLAELEELGKDELFYHDLLGMRVETLQGVSVGRIVEVYELRPADLLEIRGPGGTVLIPFTRDVVVSVDAEAERLVIDPPEGLLDLQGSDGPGGS